MLYLVTSGSVKITLPSEMGRETVLAVLSQGDFFGEMSLFDEKPRSATAVALESTQTLTLHREDFLAFIKEHPQVALSLLAILSTRLRHTDGVVEDVVFRNVASRTAKKLLELAEDHGRESEEGIEIQMRLTQQELSNMIGASRESVNRELRLLKAQGLIRMKGQRIRILHPEELSKRI